MAVGSPQAGSTLLADRRLPVQPGENLRPADCRRQRWDCLYRRQPSTIWFPPLLCSQTGAPMVEVPITIACGNYDRTAAIRDGRVKVDGCAVTYLPLYPEEIFHRAFKFHEFDVSELSFSSYLRTVAGGTSPYIGIPAF